MPFVTVHACHGACSDACSCWWLCCILVWAKRGCFLSCGSSSNRARTKKKHLLHRLPRHDRKPATTASIHGLDGMVPSHHLCNRYLPGSSAPRNYSRRPTCECTGPPPAQKSSSHGSGLCCLPLDHPQSCRPAIRSIRRPVPIGACPKDPMGRNRDGRQAISQAASSSGSCPIGHVLHRSSSAEAGLSSPG